MLFVTKGDLEQKLPFSSSPDGVLKSKLMVMRGKKEGSFSWKSKLQT